MSRYFKYFHMNFHLFQVCVCNFAKRVGPHFKIFFRLWADLGSLIRSLFFLLTCCSELQFFALLQRRMKIQWLKIGQNCHFVRLIAQPGAESIFSLVYLGSIPNSIELLCTLEWKKVAENKHLFQRIFPPKNRKFWMAMYFWLHIQTSIFDRNFSKNS